MFDSILMPVDGSEHAKKALAVACQLVHEGSTLHLLHIPEQISHETPLVWGIGPVTLEASQEERERVGRQLIARAAEAAREQGVTRVETQLVQGDPVRTILSEAKKRGVDAIVMGSRGLSDLQGFVVGSVSHKVSHAAECTVITVR
ncbi:universal stress protein [Halomonas sp. EGI 63088]|uniref:Universal stress protein n=1 Tax=Halomonas flagellata TaxID=2920385 RepID=A0ABS9RS30_9GAMM|nr:universal stress protein [Halomonas flagellata]MCH4562644.1 universal stress protein [Halomonas flagellata]